MAGLPGTGKSTLAAHLARSLEAVVLDKDRVRAALFPPPVLDYSAAQDDIAMAAVYHAASVIVRSRPWQAVLLDGRTFLRPGQVQPLLEVARSLGEQARIIECVCDDAVACVRLERDLAEGRHLAGNRTFALYQSLKEAAVPILLPHLVVDTGATPLEECLLQCLEYLGHPLSESVTISTQSTIRKARGR
jgi:adenylylsulfate kinase